MPLPRHGNREPLIDRQFLRRYNKLSKADYADLCFDFLRESYGEGISDEEVMKIIEKRHALLKKQREGK